MSGEYHFNNNYIIRIIIVMTTIAYTGASPLVIPGLNPGNHTVKVIPVSIDGCSKVVGRNLLINIPN